MGMFDFLTKNENARTVRRADGGGFDLGADGKKSPVAVYHPRSFDDVEHIIDSLRLTQPAIVYLNEVKEETAQRTLDMLCGAIYALRGGVYEIEKGIFIFTPDGVNVNL